jgi:anaphase-promoting complex subunit 5
MDELPPTSFVLRPHHVELLKVFSTAFQELREQKFPPQYLLHLYRVLMQEVAEVHIFISSLTSKSNALKIEEPRTHQELMEQLKSGPCADNHVPEFMIRRVENCVSSPCLLLDTSAGLCRSSIQNCKHMMI